MKTAAWRAGYRTTNGFEQFYRDWQPSEEHYPPILALHGSLTQSGMWVAMAESAASIRMLCLDQRGFGLSGDPGSDLRAEFAADAIALADDLNHDQYVTPLRARRLHPYEPRWLPPALRGGARLRPAARDRPCCH